MKSPPLPIVVLISGFGSNLQAIIDAVERGLPVIIQAVISNKAEAFGLQRAKKAKIPIEIIPHEDFDSHIAFEKHLLETIDRYHPKLVALAGFMRKLEPSLVHHYQGRMVNIHPSLLPKHKGLHTHQRVLAAGDKTHGVSVHFVTEAVDGGPVICQASLSIKPKDTAENLKERIHALEHLIYPQVLAWFAEGRIVLKEGRVYFDRQVQPSTGIPLDISGPGYLRHP